MMCGSVGHLGDLAETGKALRPDLTIFDSVRR